MDICSFPSNIYTTLNISHEIIYEEMIQKHEHGMKSE